MEIQDFVKINKDFWSQFKIKQGGKKLLIEEPRRQALTHVNAVMAMILNLARGYEPVWFYSQFCQPKEILDSYFPGAQTIADKDHLRMKVWAMLIAILKFPKLYFTKNILAFSYAGVRYGDILYDSILHLYKLGTVRKIDYKVLRVAALCIYRHLTIKKILRGGNYAGIFVSHQIGIGSGIMLRAALSLGYEGYLRCGQNQATLQRFTKVEDVYDYEYKPYPEDIENIISRLGNHFEAAWQDIMLRQTKGDKNEVEREGINAFDSENKVYTDRTIFNQKYGLEQDKKNIFIMLHSLNDHPHSHFRWMLFKDYYDWMVKTLEFAKKNSQVNWIFKQHPTIKYYRTNDVDYNKIFSNLPPHIIYLSEEEKLNTETLIYCADLAVTCVGSAAFELPALGAVAGLCASDTFYNGLGFALEPQTQAEYFEILKNSDKITKISQKQQQRAQAAYMHIHRFCKVNISACPVLTIDQIKDSKTQAWYWQEVAAHYLKNASRFAEQVKEYTAVAADPDFRRLNSFENYLIENNWQ